MRQGNMVSAIGSMNAWLPCHVRGVYSVNHILDGLMYSERFASQDWKLVSMRIFLHLALTLVHEYGSRNLMHAPWEGYLRVLFQDGRNVKPFKAGGGWEYSQVM